MREAPKAVKGRGRPSRKAEIVAATERLLRKKGLAGVTTRAIAEAVPCSEGAIYFHFEDRLALILAVLEESLPAMLVPLHALKEKIGHDTVEANLVIAVQGLMQFHQRVMVMLCSLVGEPELRERFRQSLGKDGRGPERGVATLARYIEEEKKLSRIAPSVDSWTAARALMAGSFFHVFTVELLGIGEGFDVDGLVRMALRA
ncbi:MAG: TetR/AcrR family transcriptional regulator [Acidobacteria bacterium]|nr:TetR/AcrR family transcriptional regulator [Acidobacteriota bacterium]